MKQKMKSTARVSQQYTDRGATVTLVLQQNGKLDNATMDFGAQPFNPSLLYDVFQKDQFNCYPYVVICSQSEHSKALDAAAAMGIADRVLVNPSVADMMVAASYAKGASKGYNASKSQELDKLLLQWERDIITSVFPDANVFCPREERSGNEDVRVILNGKKVFREENKSISNQMNITERLHMVSGKGMSTGQGEVYDLFVSFTGYDLKFLDFIPTHAPSHIAKAYVEFSVAEQTALFKDKKLVGFNTKKVMVPANPTDAAKGLKEGPLLKDYIINAIKKNM